MKRLVCWFLFIVCMVGGAQAEKFSDFFMPIEIQNITVTKQTNIETKEKYNQIVATFKVRIRDAKKIAFPLAQKYLKDHTVHLEDEWGREYVGDVISLGSHNNNTGTFGTISIRFVIPEKEAKGIKQLSVKGNLSFIITKVVDGGIYEVPLENDVIVPVKVPAIVAQPTVNLDDDLVWGNAPTDDYLSIEDYPGNSGVNQSFHCRVSLLSNASLPVVALVTLDKNHQRINAQKGTGAFIGQRPNIGKYYVSSSVFIPKAPSGLKSLYINILYGVDARDVSLPIDIKLNMAGAGN